MKPGGVLGCSEDHDLQYVTRVLTGEMDAYFGNILTFQTSEKYKVMDPKNK